MIDYIKNFLKENQDYIVAGRYQQLFDSCSLNHRADLAEALMKANVQFIDKMYAIPDSMFMLSGFTGKFTVPSNIHTISEEAFRGSNFDEIFIQDPYTSRFFLERMCFAEMEQLKKIRLPNKLIIIPTYSFANCKQLEYIELPEGVSHIDTGAFEQSGLLQIHIPSTIREIGPGAFDNGTAVKVLYNGTFDQWQKVELYDNDNLIVKYLK